MPEILSAESALTAITEIFYSDVSDRVATYGIGRILSEAGYGPHARVKTEPASKAKGSPLLYRNDELIANGNVYAAHQWWQAARADDGRVYRYNGYGNWILPPQAVQDTFRPF
jgi:hypothetical protein